uniref:Uncharacterized protein n=1 Tax=Arion vulgaris TaxID=1028688 RepID=A0A0B7B525_9EUPU
MDIRTYLCCPSSYETSQDLTILLTTITVLSHFVLSIEFDFHEILSWCVVTFQVS